MVPSSLDAMRQPGPREAAWGGRSELWALLGRYMWTYALVLAAASCLAGGRASALHLVAGTYELPADEASPSVVLKTSGGINVGWTLHVVLDNFRFSPDTMNQLHRPGEGTAYLFVDGVRTARLLGPWFQLPELADGPHRLFVGLVTNDARDITVDGRMVGSGMQLRIPELNPWGANATATPQPGRLSLSWLAALATDLAPVLLPLLFLTAGLLGGCAIGRTRVYDVRDEPQGGPFGRPGPTRGRMTRRAALSLGGIAILVTAALAGLAGLATSRTGSRAGSLAIQEQVRLTNLGTNEPALLPDQQGRPVLLHFASPECKEACALLLNRTAQVAWRLKELAGRVRIEVVMLAPSPPQGNGMVPLVARFDPRLSVLRTDAETLRVLETSLRLRRASSGSGPANIPDYSPVIYAVDSDGTVEAFGLEAEPQAISDHLRAILSRSRGR